MRKSKKKVPIKKRKICKSDTKGSKRKKTGGSKGESGFGTLKTWSCASLVDKQAAAIVGKVLGAAEKKSRGVNLRSLTLAPEIRAKKATHAVVCRTLRCKLECSIEKLQARSTEKNPMFFKDETAILFGDVLC